MFGKEKLKKRFIDKYYYLCDNIDIISILYNTPNGANETMKYVEELLFSNDELIDNKGYNYFNQKRAYYDLLLDYSLSNYKLKETIILDKCLKDILASDDTTEEYTIKRKMSKIKYITRDNYINDFNLSNFFDSMYSYVLYQPKHKETVNDKINTLGEYYRIYFNNKKDKLDPTINIYSVAEIKREEKERGLKENRFIYYFGNKDTRYNNCTHFTDNEYQKYFIQEKGRSRVR